MPWSYISQLIVRLILPVQRVVMYLLTGKPELERIIANRTLPFPQRVQQIDQALDFKASKPIDREAEQAKAERKKSLLHDQLYVVMHKLELYQELIQQIEQIRLTKVTSTDEQHLDLFAKIWSRLVDDQEEMAMVSKSWKKIGFQVCFSERATLASLLRFLAGFQSADGLSR